MSEVGRIGMFEHAHPKPCMYGYRRQNCENEVGPRSCKRHPGRTPGMPLCPERIVRRTGPTHHPAPDHVREDWKYYHSERLPANMRHRIERHVPAVERGKIATQLGR